MGLFDQYGDYVGNAGNDYDEYGDFIGDSGGLYSNWSGTANLSNPTPAQTSNMGSGNVFQGIPFAASPDPFAGTPLAWNNGLAGGSSLSFLSGIDSNTGLISGISPGPANSPTPTGQTPGFLSDLFRGLGQSVPAAVGNGISNLLNRFANPVLRTNSTQPPNSANPTSQNAILGMSPTTLLLLGGGLLLVVFLARK